MNTQIPFDEKLALKEAYASHGRKTKRMIRDAWMNGNYGMFAMNVDTSALQRFRNSEHGGPMGLNKIKWNAL